jgi:N-acetylglucosamine-6-phosphate deacetylase
VVELAISGLQIYDAAGLKKNAALIIADGKIEKITAADDAANSNAQQILTYPASYHLVPGFIDLHIHGAMGHDVMDGTPEALHAMGVALAQEGTTGYLATTMTAAPKDIARVLKNIAVVMTDQTNIKGAAILGVHLEGPFLSRPRVGAQRADKILPCNIKLVQEWQALCHDTIKIITLAPELPNSVALIKYLITQNIVAAIGHTDANYQEALLAIDVGCRYVTHLFNAMRSLHHREPGAVTAALLAEHVTTEIIADGIHLHPAVVKLAVKIKGLARIVLVTDAMRAKCMPDGCYDLGDQVVEVTNGKAMLPDGTLAGSTLQMSHALKNLQTFTHYPLAEIIKTVTENPAKILNIFDRKGSIEVGKDADLVVLDDRLQVKLTVRNGQIIYQDPSA